MAAMFLYEARAVHTALDQRHSAHQSNEPMVYSHACCDARACGQPEKMTDEIIEGFFLSG